jgi:hypothetical protein
MMMLMIQSIPKKLWFSYSFLKELTKHTIIIIIIIIIINVKATVIPVIIGASGTISKSLRQYLSNIQGKHEIKELQKAAILGTAHILRKVLT